MVIFKETLEKRLVEKENRINSAGDMHDVFCIFRTQIDHITHRLRVRRPGSNILKIKSRSKSL